MLPLAQPGGQHILRDDRQPEGPQLRATECLPPWKPEGGFALEKEDVIRAIDHSARVDLSAPTVVQRVPLAAVRRVPLAATKPSAAAVCSVVASVHGAMVIARRIQRVSGRGGHSKRATDVSAQVEPIKGRDDRLGAFHVLAAPIGTEALQVHEQKRRHLP